MRGQWKRIGLEIHLFKLIGVFRARQNLMLLGLLLETNILNFEKVITLKEQYGCGSKRLGVRWLEPEFQSILFRLMKLPFYYI